MLRLPLELCRYVFEDKDVLLRDLCSLSRVCRAFQFEAERCLYVAIEVKSLADFVVWCKRIIVCPRVAPLVEEFDFDSDESSFQWDRPVTLFRQSLFSTLSRALKLMTRLRVLYLPRFFEGKISCGSLFEGCTCKLNTFCSHFPIDSYLIDFLKRQDEITEFEDLG
jgi:hypothetical protein